jgi:hypothetical protein
LVVGVGFSPSNPMEIETRALVTQVNAIPKLVSVAAQV